MLRLACNEECPGLMTGILPYEVARADLVLTTKEQKTCVEYVEERRKQKV